jgi:cystathionine beta-lyase/cystathionine gamma-synthase
VADAESHVQQVASGRVQFADLRYAERFTQAVTPPPRVVYFETPVNPTLDLMDIAQVRRWVDAVNVQRPPEERLLIIEDLRAAFALV